MPEPSPAGPKIKMAPVQPIQKRIKTKVITETIPSKSPVYIQSFPSGAEVELNGELLGLTPITISDLESGAHSVVLYKKGYKLREFSFQHPQGSVQVHSLEQEDNSALITSNPSGAVVTIGGQKQGHTPLLLTDLPNGSTKVKISSLGFASGTFYVNNLENWKRDHLHVDLKSIVGSVSIVTNPPGCKIFLDGDLMGTTEGIFGDQLSKPLVLKDVLPGEYKLKVASVDESETKESTITIQGGEQVESKISLKFVNSVLKLINGEQLYGIVLTKDESEVTYSYRKKGEQSFEEWQTISVKVSEIESINRSSLQEMLGFSKGIHLQADYFKDLQPSIHDENDSTDYEAILEEADDLGELAASSLIKDYNDLDLLSLVAKYRHKKVTVTGKVTLIREGEKMFSIVLEDRVECYLHKDENLRPKLSTLKGKDVKISGLCIGAGGLDRIVIVESQLNE